MDATTMQQIYDEADAKMGGIYADNLAFKMLCMKTGRAALDSDCRRAGMVSPTEASVEAGPEYVREALGHYRNAIDHYAAMLATVLYDPYVSGTITARSDSMTAKQKAVAGAIKAIRQKAKYAKIRDLACGEAFTVIKDARFDMWHQSRLQTDAHRALVDLMHGLINETEIWRLDEL